MWVVKVKIHTGLEIGKTCWRCGKKVVQYYNILCMDCADELGISEIFKPKLEDVKKKIEEDIRNAVEIHKDGKYKRIFIKWYPMFNRFPNITLEAIYKLMGLELIDEKTKKIMGKEKVW